MEPAFYRGDLLFLTNYEEDPIRAGEIVVFKIEGRDIPIVHRVIKLHETYGSDDYVVACDNIHHSLCYIFSPIGARTFMSYARMGLRDSKQQKGPINQRFSRRKYIT